MATLFGNFNASLIPYRQKTRRMAGHEVSMEQLFELVSGPLLVLIAAIISIGASRVYTRKD